MLCPKCKVDIQNFKKYVFHLKLIHSITNHFVCPIENCHRTYDTKYNLKDHLFDFHKLLKERKLDSNEVVPLRPQVVPSQSVTVSTLPQQDKVNSDIKETRSTYNVSCNVDDKLLDIQNGLNSGILGLIVNLYSALAIPRSKVKDIITSFHTTLSWRKIVYFIF
jgi:hypothetical protein